MIKKILWLSLLALLLLIIGFSVFLFIQKDFIKNQSIKALNSQLETQIEVKGAIDLTFISTLPNITLSFNEVYIADNLRTNDTLAALDNVRLQLNPWALLKKDVTIDGIHARDGFIHLYIDETGQSNYDILKAKENEGESSLLQLSKIALHNVDVVYDDEDNNIYTHLLSIESEIAGSFYETDFDLNIKTDLFNHQLLIDGTPLFSGKKLAGKLKMTYTEKDGCINFDQNTIRIQNNDFLVSGAICTKTKQIDLSASADGSNLKEALSLVPEEWLDVKEINGNGAFDIHALINGELNNPNIQLDFSIKEGTLSFEKEKLALTNLNLNGSFVKSPNNKQSLIMKKFYAVIDGSELHGDFNIPDLNNIKLRANLNGNLTKTLINSVLSEAIQVTNGSIDVQGLSLLIHQNKADNLWQLESIEGSLSLDSLKGNTNPLSLPFLCTGKLIGKENFLRGENIQLNIGDNDLSFNGELRNLMAIVLNQDKESMLDVGIEGSLRSQYFNLNDFIQSGPNIQGFEEKKEISFPPIYGTLDLEIDHFIYQNLDVKHVDIDVLANNSAYTFTINSAEALGGDFDGRLLTNVKQNDFEINLNCNINDIEIQALFDAFDNFGQEDLGSDNIKGLMSCHLAFSATWKDFTHFDAENFIMQSHIVLKDGELINFAPLLSLSGKLELEQLEHLYFTDLEADITVKNQWIQIPMTTIQTNLLSLEAGGRHSFDNDIDYKLILNLKNLLAAKFKKNKTTEEDYVNDAKGGINLYISMTGTADNPVIKYDKHSVKDKIKSDFKEEKEEFKNLFKKDEKSEFEQNEIKFEELKEEDKYLEWED
jgi:hypothetical protein